MKYEWIYTVTMEDGEEVDKEFYGTEEEMETKLELWRERGCDTSDAWAQVDEQGNCLVVY